jgi:hypothetical protein
MARSMVSVEWNMTVNFQQEAAYSFMQEIYIYLKGQKNLKIKMFCLST